MALLELNLYSETLGMNTQVNIILPQQLPELGVCAERKNGKYPVLWLLHPAGGNYSIWCRRTSIERYAENKGLAVVMPSAQLSMYTNMVYGGKYFDYISKELKSVLPDIFPLSEEREMNYIAGASLGGYGAMKIGLSCPENYAAIGCFSSGNLYCDKDHLMAEQTVIGRRADKMYEAVFGTADTQSLQGTEHDLFALAERVLRSGGKVPRIYQICGDRDWILPYSREMSQWFKVSGKFEYLYKQESGSHDWAFWDVWIQDFLNWL